ncbi:MAG: nucleotidyltransferase domain-containing protein [Actinomycetota bacterium]
MSSLVPVRSLEIIVALQVRLEGVGLSELARILEAPISSVQRALEPLTGDGYVVRAGAGRSPYRLDRDMPAARSLTEFAARALRRDRAVEVAIRAACCLEFAGVDTDGYLLVPSASADPADETSLRRCLADVIGETPDGPTIRRVIRDDARRRHDLRRRATGMQVLTGSVDRSFPERRRHGRGNPLGGLHPSLTRPAFRAVRGLARAHGLRRVVVFGSAVRSDFTPGSDVDVLVEPVPGTTLDLDARAALRDGFEELFGRDVDVVPADMARDSVTREAESGVVLHG